jgi:UDP-glucose 4-epimerase
VAETTPAALDADGGVYDIGTGRETSVLELLERIEQVAGREATPEFVERRPGELQRSVPDVSRSGDLGWRPRHALDEGLAGTWTWITS